ncbi:flavin-containing monooxygenase [Hydrocarboniclastica marina]|uniref:NAD(P)/FAD-dependent oxidoreductase n=1 Tax=Hydrocarboniclastica marina TaxID=2259620 RepID=A0A4P7XKT3_9ALTE|nr:NAD(P)/FAD-dependent oxidoreductase [Hydrocarboniclastica marina]QCF27678.1 NAD(P)/FAD-dependent oxidoreductase [Hydrocarboniclastica marina]
MNSRPPINTAPQCVEAVIVGAGFGGLCMAIKLREAGIQNFVILEKDQEVGGSWRDNSYPGCACDVQSHMYSYSFFGKADWSKRYAPWHEIQQYILEAVDHYGLRPFIQFNQEVNSAHFDADTGRWNISAGSGQTFSCKHFILASGPLHVPAIPKIKGLDNFKGKVFHSAQWDHEYDLKGKNVVSIGTGGSAIQYVPEIAPHVAQLYVMQRSAAWVIPRDERKYGRIRKKLFQRFPVLRKLHRARLYWTNESRVWPVFHPALARALQKLAQLFIRIQVKDRQLVEKLTPDYTIGCKRVLISNKWYPTFNRKNVELVTDNVSEIRENSIVTQDGSERPADCIILGTGFIVDPRIYMKEFALTGLPGHDIHKDWKDGAESYLGVTTAGYPNMYQLVGPNSGLGHNSIIFMIEAQANYIIQCMQKLKQTGADYLDLRPEVQREFNEKVQEAIKGTVWNTGCTSWYQQDGGKNFAVWPWSTWRFWLRTRRLDAGEYRWMRCKPAQKPAVAEREEATALQP